MYIRKPRITRKFNGNFNGTDVSLNGMHCLNVTFSSKYFLRRAYSDNSPLRLFGQHFFAVLVVAPEPGRAGVVAGIDAPRCRSVEAILGRILQPEPASVGSQTKQKLTLFSTFLEPVLDGEVRVEVEARRGFIQFVGSGVEG